MPRHRGARDCGARHRLSGRAMINAGPDGAAETLPPSAAQGHGLYHSHSMVAGGLPLMS